MPYQVDGDRMAPIDTSPASIATALRADHADRCSMYWHSDYAGAQTCDPESCGLDDRRATLADALDRIASVTWEERIGRAVRGIDGYWEENGWPTAPTHGPGQRALLDLILRAAFPENAPPAPLDAPTTGQAMSAEKMALDGIGGECGDHGPSLRQTPEQALRQEVADALCIDPTWIRVSGRNITISADALLASPKVR